MISIRVWFLRILSCTTIFGVLFIGPGCPPPSAPPDEQHPATVQKTQVVSTGHLTSCAHGETARFRSDTSELYCELERQQYHSLDGRPAPVVDPDELCSYAKQYFKATDPTGNFSIETCLSTATANPPATRYQSLFHQQMMEPILASVMTAGASIKFEVDPGHKVIIGPDHIGTECLTARPSINNPNASFILVDSNFPALIFGVSKVIGLLMIDVEQEGYSTGTPETLAHTAVKRNPAVVAVFREELLRYFGSGFSTGYSYFSNVQTPAVALLAEAMEIFAVAHEYAHIVLNHHRLTSASTDHCRQWVEELVADYHAQRILNAIILENIEAPSGPLPLDSYNAGILSIRLLTMLRSAGKSTSDEERKISNEDFKALWDHFQDFMNGGSQAKLEDYFRTLDCKTGSHPSLDVRYIALFRAMVLDNIINLDPTKSRFSHVSMNLFDELSSAAKDDLARAIKYDERAKASAPKLLGSEGPLFNTHRVWYPSFDDQEKTLIIKTARQMSAQVSIGEQTVDSGPSVPWNTIFRTRLTLARRPDLKEQSWDLNAYIHDYCTDKECFTRELSASPVVTATFSPLESGFVFRDYQVYAPEDMGVGSVQQFDRIIRMILISPPGLVVRNGSRWDRKVSRERRARRELFYRRSSLQAAQGCIIEYDVDIQRAREPMAARHTVLDTSDSAEHRRTSSGKSVYICNELLPRFGEIHTNSTIQLGRDLDGGNSLTNATWETRIEFFDDAGRIYRTSADIRRKEHVK